jgi:glycosyltransferase involved in cell wall biosynthesis
MKISVITVAFNSAKTITGTLNSVAAQTYPNIEYILIDGASTDETLALVHNYNNLDIKIVSESDSGIYDAMNKGLALASGEIVGFLNSDDSYADAAVLAKIANAFQDPSVDACYADLVYVSKDNSRVVRYWKSKPFTKGDFAKGWCPAHPTFYVRKSVIDRIGFFDQSFKMGVDVEFMMRYLECQLIRAVYIPHVLVRMRIGGASNQSLRNIVLQNKEILSALRKNGIPFSIMLFVVQKVLSRLNQFVIGRFGRHQ